MTSRRSIMLSLMLGAFLSVTGLNTAYAQVPRSISYQGLLIKAGQPVNSQVNVKINVYNAAGQVLYTETMNQVQVNNGIFNVLLGGNSGLLPSSLKFDEQYYLGVDVDNTGEISPRTPFTAAPYALNAQTVGGVGVSVTPQPGMLLPLDANGKIPASVLPQATKAIDNINGVTGDVSGKLNLTGDGIITVTSNPATNTIKLGFAGGTGNGVKHIMAGPGLTGGGSDTTVEIHVADNGIVTNMIGTGVVTGIKLDQFVAGDGLISDILGNLNVNTDATLKITADKVGLNLANPNTWTALQTFNSGVTVNGTTTLTGPVNITGTTTQTGNYTLNGNFVVNGIAEPNALNGAAVTNYEIINNGDLRVTGFSYLNGNTDINGSIQNSSANNGGAVFVNDPNGLTNNAGNLTNTLGNIVNTSGNIINTLGNINNLAGNINNTGQINNTGALNETGVSTLNGNLIQGNGTGTTATFQNNSATFNLTNSGTNGNSVIINGTPNPNAASAAAVANYELNLNGDLQVNGATNLVGNTYLNQTLTVGGLTTANGGVISNGAFTENGASTFNGTINQTGAANTVTFAGPTTINNTLNVTGLSTLAGVTNNGTLTQNGVITQTSLGIAPNNTLLATIFNGNVQINGTLGNTGNATLGTGAGTTNSLGNAGSSTNTITGLNNQIIATNTNTITGLINNINGVTNINGNTTITGNEQVNGTLGNTGNVTLATNPGTTNTFGGAGSANRFNGVSNFGSIAASNGNKLIVDGSPNIGIPTSPSNVPPGFIQNADYEEIINGDLLVTGFSNLRSATIGDLLVTSSFTLPASASFCANNIQVAQLSSWCGGAAGAAIAVNTAFNQNSLGTSVANTFLGTNFTGNVAITGGLTSTGNTSLATLGGSTASVGNSTGATTINGNLISMNGPTNHVGNITQTSGSAQFLNTQINGTLGSTGNVTLGTASTTNTIGAAGATNTLTGLNNQLLATAANTLTAPQNNLNGALTQTGNSTITGGTTTFNTNPIVLNNSNINGSNNSNISNVTTVQANVSMTIGVGTNATTLTSTNTTGAAINQQLASVGGKIPVYLRQVLQLTGVGGGPNGGAITPLYTFGANGFDNNDAITVTYYTRNGAQFGQIYPVNINTAAGTLQVESTNPLDVNTVQVVILRD